MATNNPERLSNGAEPVVIVMQQQHEKLKKVSDGIGVAALAQLQPFILEGPYNTDASGQLMLN